MTNSAASDTQINQAAFFAMFCGCTWFNYAPPDTPGKSCLALDLEDELVRMVWHAKECGIRDFLYKPDPFVRENLVSIDGRFWKQTSYHRHVFDWVGGVFGEILCLAGFQELGDCWEFKNEAQVLEAIELVFREHSPESVWRAVIGDVKQSAIMDLPEELALESSRASRLTPIETELVGREAIAKHPSDLPAVETGTDTIEDVLTGLSLGLFQRMRKSKHFLSFDSLSEIQGWRKRPPNDPAIVKALERLKVAVEEFAFDVEIRTKERRAKLTKLTTN
jgi:hypothetical protein